MIKAVIVMLLSVLALPMLAQDKVVLKDDVIKVYIDVDNDFIFVSCFHLNRIYSMMLIFLRREEIVSN